MVIADVTSFFSDSCGGIKTYYREKARWLPRLGIRCHFVVPGRRTTAQKFAGGTLHTVAGPPLNRHYRVFGDLAELGRVLRELAPDIIEIGSHYVLPDLVVRAVRDIRPQPRIIGFYHSDFPATYVEPALANFPRVQQAAVSAAWHLVRRQHARYDATLVASSYIADKLVSAQIPRVRWVGLGVDSEQFRPRGPRGDTHGIAGNTHSAWRGGRSKKAPLLVYSGRLSNDKQFDVLLAAYDHIYARAGARLLIVGDGPLMSDARLFAAVRPQVTLCGYLDNSEQVARLLARADAVIAPGPYETFSLTAAESLACGTPVIAADHGGNAELVTRSGGGVTFPSGNANALARQVIDIVTAPAQRRARMGDDGRRYVVENLTWRRVFAHIYRVYGEVLGRGSVPFPGDTYPGKVDPARRRRGIEKGA